jgi:hypothetical protein
VDPCYFGALLIILILYPVCSGFVREVLFEFAYQGGEIWKITGKNIK